MWNIYFICCFQVYDRISSKCLATCRSLPSDAVHKAKEVSQNTPHTPQLACCNVSSIHKGIIFPEGWLIHMRVIP